MSIVVLEDVVVTAKEGRGGGEERERSS